MRSGTRPKGWRNGSFCANAPSPVALLYHLSQADFFAAQTEWGDAGLSYQARTLAHNLEFFADWMRRLRGAVNQGRILEFCRINLPTRAFQHCANVAGWSLS